MLSRLGRSIYLSCLSEDMPPELTTGGIPVFLSLHVPEDYGEDFCKKAQRLCDSLYEKKCRVIADFSKHSLEVFSAPDLPTLAERLHIYMVRPDYGFSVREIADMAAAMPVCLNAGTLSLEEATLVARNGDSVCAMHNFYPRPETGLDAESYMTKTKMLREAGIKVAAFIAGTGKRGPIFEGLPTMEEHRYIHPYVAWAELIYRYHTDQVYVGDPGLDFETENMINETADSGILQIPCTLDPLYRNLYGCVFTNRADAPSSLIRFAESRLSCRLTDEQATPHHTNFRKRGSVTADNSLYMRYCGELQITRADLPADKKVNVIGEVDEDFLGLLPLVTQRGSFKMVPAEKGKAKRNR